MKRMQQFFMTIGIVIAATAVTLVTDFLDSRFVYGLADYHVSYVRTVLIAIVTAIMSIVIMRLIGLFQSYVNNVSHTIEVHPQFIVVPPPQADDDQDDADEDEHEDEVKEEERRRRHNEQNRRYRARKKAEMAALKAQIKQ